MYAICTGAKGYLNDNSVFMSTKCLLQQPCTAANTSQTHLNIDLERLHFQIFCT